MGSAGVAAWIAHMAFWTLLLYGWGWQELKSSGIAMYVVLWAAGLFGLPYLHPLGPAAFSSYVALLDITLVILIFKGDVRLT